jgi:FkbM family methyltransferase
MIYNRFDATVGRSLAELGEFAQSEVEVFQQCVRPGASVVDAGANIGAHTITLAHLVGHKGDVHALEPQRVLYQTLAGNVALSSLTQVHCHHAAVGEREGTIFVPTFDFTKPNNFGALELGKYEEGERVRLMTIDSLGLARCSFMKLDVSGMEAAAVRGARETLARCRPIVYVAADRPEKAPAVIEELFACGYKLYWHVPRYYDAGNYYGNEHNAFGSLAALNILGVHESVPTDLQGLAPITSPQSDWRNSSS